MKNDSNLSIFQKTVVGAQFLFVAFGATVLVPLLVGLDPSVALFTAGVGTLIFHLVTKGKVPVFLGSSFAFIAPIIKFGTIASLILTLGIGGAELTIGSFTIGGIGLSAVVGVLLNLIIPHKKQN